MPQNEIFADWGQWRERGRLNQDLEDAIDALANLIAPPASGTRPAKLEMPGVVVLDLYDTNPSDDQSVTLSVGSYFHDAAAPYALRAPEGPDALVEASLDGGSLTISMPDGSTADGLTAVTVVSKNTAGLPVSWTVLVHVVAVEGYTVQEQAWGETTWHAPEDRGDDWALLWQSNEHRWLPQTTFAGRVGDRPGRTDRDVRRPDDLLRHHQHSPGGHPEILQPLEHTTVRVKVELAEPVPDGMVGTLHLAWYDPDNTLGNEPSTPPAHNGHGRRDNAEDVELVEAGAPLPGFTLEFSTAGASSTSDSIQKSYLAVKEARYADNFIVAAHPNQNIVTQYEFRENDVQKLVLMYQENTGQWAELPDDAQQGDFQTSILTIMPSVDIDCDSDNTATPTWHGIDRSDWEEQIENDPEYPGKIVADNNNDDNKNGIEDYLENADYEYPTGMSWVPFTDPDLVPVVLDRGFADLTGMDGFLFELKVTIGSERGLSYWLDQQKTPIIGSAYHPDDWDEFEEAGKMKRVYQWIVCGEAVNYPPLIYVEGINPEALTDTLIWRLLDPEVEEIDVDTVKITDPYLNVDLDVDSDNNNNNGLELPDRSPQEETIEAVAPGKIIQSWIGKDYDFDLIPDFADGYNLDGQPDTSVAR